jgi:hypothetical protein
VLNSYIEVSNYNEPYSLCQPPSSLPNNPWFNDDKPYGIHTLLQGDSQTERMNAVLEQHLRTYMSYMQDD